MTAANEKHDDEMDTEVSWFPESLEECHELLTFYREQMTMLKHERTEYENVLKSLEMTNQEKHKLEWDLHHKSEVNEGLKKQLSDVHILLYNEKNSNIRFESEIKSSNAEINELQQHKLHLLELLQSANDNINGFIDSNRKHKGCNACNHQHRQQRINKMRNEKNPQKLTTIYLPNDSAAMMHKQLNAKEEELMKIKEQTLQINEYLINDRNKAHNTLETLRNEYNAKFESLQNGIAEVSKQHLFNLKEYLGYKRKTKQEIHDLQTRLLQIKQENNTMKQKCDMRVGCIVSNTNKMESELKKKSSKLVNGFRLETIKKHEELNNVKDELMTLTKSYKFDVKHLKSKLNATKRKNKKLNQINKCQKEGIQTDVENMKKRLNKLQKTMDNLSQNTNDMYQTSLQNEIDKVKRKLLELAKISEP